MGLSPSNPAGSPAGAFTWPVLLLSRLASALLCGVLRLHRLFVSPWLGPACRFEPSCSRFAERAIDRHGWRRGIVLAAARLIRCHPWGGPGGFDPVP